MLLIEPSSHDNGINENNLAKGPQSALFVSNWISLLRKQVREGDPLGNAYEVHDSEEALARDF